MRGSDNPSSHKEKEMSNSNSSDAFGQDKTVTIIVNGRQCERRPESAAIWPV